MVVEHLELQTTTISLSMHNSHLLCKLVEMKVLELCMVDMANHRIHLEEAKAQVMAPHLASVLPHLDIHLPRQRSMLLRVQALFPLHLQEEEEPEELVIHLLHPGSTLPHLLSHLQVQVIHQLHLLSRLLHPPSHLQVHDSVLHLHHSHLHRRDSHQAVQRSHLHHRASHLLPHLTLLLRPSTAPQAHSTRLQVLNTRLLARNIALLAHSTVRQVRSTALPVLSIALRARLCRLLHLLMKRRSRHRLLLVLTELQDSLLVLLVSCADHLH